MNGTVRNFLVEFVVASQCVSNLDVGRFIRSWRRRCKEENLKMRYEIVVKQTVVFQHSVFVDVPDGVDIDSVLDVAYWELYVDDFVDSLGRQGCVVEKVIADDSGRAEEFEIYDVIRKDV